jgi:hypothetical protein
MLVGPLAGSAASPPGGPMGKPHKLFDKFTNRKKRSESDCAVIQEIVDFYQTSGDDSSRKESLKWLFQTMEDKDTKEIARARIAFLLGAIRDALPAKKRRRLEKFERKAATRKKGARDRKAAPEPTVPGDRAEPA